MGEIKIISCCNCGKSWECRTGCGILHGSLKEIAKSYEKEMAEEIRALALQQPPVLYDFSFHAAQCMYCRNVVSIPMLSVKQSGKTYTGLCSVCGKNAELQQNTERMVCPACNTSGLEQSEIGRWD